MGLCQTVLLQWQFFCMKLCYSQDLCDKLLEVVEIAPPEMKREIITALPEILDDPQHNDAAMKLKYVV